MKIGKDAAYKPDFSQKFTADTYTIKNAPKKIQLIGDKRRAIEAAQHIIEFPGGAIELSRTTDGDYWAHIICNRGFADSDSNGMHSALGEIIGARIDSDDGVQPIPTHENITQVALLIRPKR